MSDSQDPTQEGSTAGPPPPADPPPPPPQSDSSGTGSSSSGMEPNVAAALSYLLGLITGIIFLLIEKENRYVRFHAWQSIFFSLALFAINIVVGLIPMIGCFVSPLLILAGLVLWIVLMVKAYQGEKFKLPVIGDIAANQS